jgi:hypothetical protein
LTTCDRCGKENEPLRKFCNGDYYFCEDCAKNWIDLLEASDWRGNWNLELFKWWMEHSPNVIYNPSKRFPPKRFKE